MKIKDEYKGKTLISYDSVLGERRIEVDKIDPKRFTYYTSIGLGYLFEKESQTISYTGIDHEVAQAGPNRGRHGWPIQPVHNSKIK
jgi:hypothetical protein